MPRLIVSSFFVELDCIHIVLNSNRNLVKLLQRVGWVNSVVIEENVYLNLVKVFYSNMDTFKEKRNRVITHIGGIIIEFGVGILNKILGNPDNSLKSYSARKALCFHDYSHFETLRNICRRMDLSDEVRTIHLYIQCLCLQSQVLLCIFQAVVIGQGM